MVGLGGRVFPAFLLVVVSLVWGLTFPLIKLALFEVDAFAFLSVRFLLAILFLFPVFWRDLFSAGVDALRDSAFVGLFLALTYLFQTVGLRYTTASKSGFITGLYVVFTPPFSRLILGTKMTPASTLAVIIAVAGMFLLSEVGPGQAVNFGDFLTLLCALACAVDVVLVGKYSRKYHYAVLSVVQMAVVWAASTVAWVLNGGGWIPLSPIVWITILYTAVFATSLALLIQNYAQRYVDPTRAAIIYSMEPASAALFSYVILGETLSLRGFLGAALIMVAILVSEIYGGREAG